MLHAEPGGGYVPPAGEAKVSAEEARLIAEEEAGPHFARLPPAQASALTFYALMVGINYMLLRRPHKARYYFALVPKLVKPGEKVSKPIDIYAKRKAAEFLAKKTDRPEVRRAAITHSHKHITSTRRRKKERNKQSP